MPSETLNIDNLVGEIIENRRYWKMQGHPTDDADLVLRQVARRLKQQSSPFIQLSFRRHAGRSIREAWW